MAKQRLKSEADQGPFTEGEARGYLGEKLGFEVSKSFWRIFTQEGDLKAKSEVAGRELFRKADLDRLANGLLKALRGGR